MSNGGRASSNGSGGGAAVKSAPLWYCLLTCCLYGFGSGSMSFFNKGLVSGLGFHYSQALLSLQMGACVAMFLMARALGWVRFTHPMPKTAHSRWWGRGELYVRLLPLSIAYCGNAMAGMLSLQGLSLPMYSVLKRFTPLLVASAEWVWFGRRTSPRVMAALALCTGGFVLAGLGDLVFDAKAYALAMISCASQAAYMISVERVGKALEMQSHELLYYNSLLSLSMILPWVLYTGELHASLFEYPHWNSPLFLAALGMMVLLGISLNWTMFLCTQVSSCSSLPSPTHTCMVWGTHGAAGGRFCLKLDPCFLCLCVYAGEFAADHLHGRRDQRSGHDGRGILHGALLNTLASPHTAAAVCLLPPILSHVSLFSVCAAAMLSSEASPPTH